MLTYRFDVLKELKAHGYNQTVILKDNIISQSTVQSIRKNHVIGAKALDQICTLLEMQPGQIIKWYDDTDYMNRYSSNQLLPFEIDQIWVNDNFKK